MLEPRVARYGWGLPVVAATDLVNDGSHPAAPAGALLVAAGARGEIVQVGHHTEANLPVYLVDFDGAVLGVLEDEIVPLAESLASPGDGA